MDRLLRTSLRAGSAPTAGECPPAEELAAFAEGSLATTERETLEVHLAACERCQEAIATLAELPEVQVGSRPRTEGQGLPVSGLRVPGFRILRWLVPAAAGATALVAYLAVRPPAPTSSADVRPAVTGNPTAPATPAQQTAKERAARSESASAAPAAGTVTRDAPQPAEAAPASANRPNPGRPGGAAATTLVQARPAAAPTPSPAAAAPAPQVAVDALELKGEAPPAKTVVADAATKPAPAGYGGGAGGVAFRVQATPPKEVAMSKALPAAPPAADVNQPRVGVVAESVAITAGQLAPIVFASRAGEARWRLEPGGVISRSSDGGTTWRRQLTDAVAELLAGSAPSATTGWVVGRQGMVLRTIDGQHWLRCRFPETVDLIAVDAKDDRSATVTTRDGRRFGTTDAGVTWSPAKEEG
jgi:hypothetical protein